MLKYIHIFSACFMLILINSIAYSQSGYHVLNTFHIASAGKWDYIAINPVTENIYVSHATQVNILNKQGDSVGVIENTTGVHGIAFAPEFGKGFTSNGTINTITVFDIKTNKVLNQIKTGDKPDAIMYDSYSKRVYVCDGKSKDLTIIDPVDDKVVNTIPLGGKPETAVSDSAGKIYINLEDKSEIAVYDIKRKAVIAHWSLGKGEGPTGLAIDRKTARLFTGCDKLLVVIDAENGKMVTTLPIGDGCDGTAFDPSLKQIYASNGEGTLSIIKEETADRYKLLENVSTKKGARTLAVDEKDHLIYLPTADLIQTKNTNGGHSRPDMVPGTFQVLVVGK